MMHQLEDVVFFGPFLQELLQFDLNLLVGVVVDLLVFVVPMDLQVDQVHMQ